MQEKNGYHDLIVWQKSMQLVVSIYALTKDFPKDEMFGLTSQIKRAAVSVPSNIAEGYRRKTTKDRGHFLTIAFGSIAELETQIEIAKRLNYLNSANCGSVDMLLSEVAKILNKMTTID
jgi:four helix bundle protein